MRTLFIADTHFGHKNCIEFDGRPWETIEEGDEEMIRRWNEKVSKEDHVYALGDFVCRNKLYVKSYTDRLNGHIHLIRGNHDKRNEQFDRCFEEITDYKDMPISLYGKPARLILCHYFIPFYNGQRRYTFMLHGHTHRSKDSDFEEKFKEEIRMSGVRCEAYNVGCMWQDYAPQTLEEIIERQKRKVDLF